MDWFLLSVAVVQVFKSAFGRMEVWYYEKGICLNVLLNNNLFSILIEKKNHFLLALKIHFFFIDWKTHFLFSGADRGGSRRVGSLPALRFTPFEPASISRC